MNNKGEMYEKTHEEIMEEEEKRREQKRDRIRNEIYEIEWETCLLRAKNEFEEEKEKGSFHMLPNVDAEREHEIKVAEAGATKINIPSNGLLTWVVFIVGIVAMIRWMF